jgi:aminoglycoside 6'-N-acetyltransferase I
MDFAICPRSCAVPELRQLGEADRVQWRALRFALWARDDDGSFDTDITAILASGGRLAAFGAFEAGLMIGLLEVGERPWGDGCDTAPVGWIEGIYVEPAHRRFGVGRDLVAAGERWARDRRYRELGSDAPIDNETSRLSHAAWGFEETKRIVMFRKQL